MKLVVAACLALSACSLYFGDSNNQSPPPDGGAGSVLVAGSRSTCTRVGTTWWCWGANYAGQLTDTQGYDPQPMLSPEAIMPRGSMLAMGGAHSCSIETGGVVTCWGSNWSGQLGYVTVAPSVNVEHNLPAAVQGLPRAGQFVATGGKHTCAILVDHSLWCWGDNTVGQLGADVASGPAPRHVLDGVATVALGDAHSCAVMMDHTVACWGANADGQLGDGSTIDRHAPTPIALTATSLALGRAHSCAIDDSGGVTCWGSNTRGQLGDGSITHAVQLVASGDHTCAIRSDGSGACWGENDDGELGDGTLTEQHAATTIAFAGPLTAIATGAAHTCALRSDHTLACWGRDSSGELGDGSHVPISLESVLLPTGAWTLAVGAFHACAAIGTDHRAYCWGDDHHGQLGDGAPELASAMPVDTGLTGVTAIAAGVSHTCAVRTDHSVWCWGDNADGELGDGTQTPHAQPSQTPYLAVAIAAGDGFTCIVTPSAALACWGRSDLVQLAIHTTLPPLAAISAAYSNACAVTTSGAVLCWGSNTSGQVGNGGVSALAGPAGPAGTYLAVAVGGHHTCAVPSSSDNALCWGGNDLDQLGDFTLADHFAPAPAAVGLGVATWAVGAGRTHTCVSGSNDSNGNAWTECFGQSTDNESAVPYRLINPPMITAAPEFASVLGGGDAFSCGLFGSSVRCWGDNSRGQLGFGEFSRSTNALELVIAH